MSPKHLDSTCVQLNSLLSPHDLVLGQDSQETAPLSAQNLQARNWVTAGSLSFSASLYPTLHKSHVCARLSKWVPDLSPSPLPSASSNKLASRLHSRNFLLTRLPVALTSSNEIPTLQPGVKSQFKKLHPSIIRSGREQ